MSAADAADEVRAGSVDGFCSGCRPTIRLHWLSSRSERRDDCGCCTDRSPSQCSRRDRPGRPRDGQPILLPLDDVVAWADAPGVMIDHRPESTSAAMGTRGRRVGRADRAAIPGPAASPQRPHVPSDRRRADVPCRACLPEGPQSEPSKTSSGSSGAVNQARRVGRLNHRPSAPPGRLFRQTGRRAAERPQVSRGRTGRRPR